MLATSNENMENKLNTDEFSEVRRHFTKGNQSKFEGCQELARIVKSRKDKSLPIEKFYDEMGWSHEYGARLKKVGEVFCDFDSGQMAAYGTSQLTRMAALDDIGRFIAKKNLKFVVEDLEVIKKNKKYFSTFMSASGFISLFESIKSGKYQAEIGEYKQPLNSIESVEASDKTTSAKKKSTSKKTGKATESGNSKTERPLTTIEFQIPTTPRSSDVADALDTIKSIVVKFGEFSTKQPYDDRDYKLFAQKIEQIQEQLRSLKDGWV